MKLKTTSNVGPLIKHHQPKGHGKRRLISHYQPSLPSLSRTILKWTPRCCMWRTCLASFHQGEIKRSPQWVTLEARGWGDKEPYFSLRMSLCKLKLIESISTSSYQWDQNSTNQYILSLDHYPFQAYKVSTDEPKQSYYLVFDWSSSTLLRGWKRIDFWGSSKGDLTTRLINGKHLIGNLSPPPTLKQIFWITTFHRSKTANSFSHFWGVKRQHIHSRTTYLSPYALHATPQE